MRWLILLLVVGLLLWTFRVKILAKVLGQPERRIERRLNQKRR